LNYFCKNIKIEILKKNTDLHLAVGNLFIIDQAGIT